MSINKNKSVVEETLLQIKAVEDAINENAKGILASTMKEEISELVRESLGGSRKSKSLREQEEDAPEMPVDTEGDGMEDDVEGFDETETEVDTELMGQPDVGPEMEVDTEVDNEELPPVDMTQSPMSDVMKVFKAMGDEDGIIVKKDSEGNIHLSDTTKGSDYLIQMDGMSNEEMPMKAEAMESVLYELSFDDGMDDYEDEDDEFSDLDSMGEYEEAVDYEDVYGISEEDDDDDDSEVRESFKPKGRVGKMKFKYPSKLKRGVTEMEDFEGEHYEGEDFEGEYHEGEDFEGEYHEGEFSEFENFEGEDFESEFSEFENFEGDHYEGEDFESEFSEIEDFEGEQYESGYLERNKPSAETTEASRTYGNGSKSGRGLRKGITPNRNLVYGRNGVQSESIRREMSLLREKNEEYKKALDFFRNKLNEVAVFNSNLAYSTRLFTEHTTTKQEKINILRRFDNVESLKESKSLYRTIKSELDDSTSDKGVFTESIQQKVIKTPQTGSATNLIENKTYENPQFLRMKDLMAKIK